MPWRALLLALLLATPAHAESPLAAIHAEKWAQADAQAATSPDPLARKLVLYYRLLTPGAARAAEIAAFMAESPGWPNQPLLSRRLQDALATDRDDRVVLEICRQRPPSAIPSLLRCADAAEHAGAPPENPVRRAWTTGITDEKQEIAFLRRWSAQLGPEDQWRRFDRLAWSETPAPGGPAARQLVRLPAAMRPAGEARLALRRDAPIAPALVAALPEAARADPALILELARWYRRAGQDRDAANTWAGPAAAAAEPAAAPERRSAFWSERNLLARRLLRAAQPDLAYTVAAAPAAAPEDAIDQTFLAGWIALRRLDQPARALQHFTALAGLSPAAITQARARYWTGRAHAALGDPAAARAAFAAAATWPTTYYGQLAAMEAGDDLPALIARIAAAADPAWSDQRALDFLGQDVARAAVLLAAWGEPRRAKAFIARLDETAPDPAGRALAARMALELGLADQAVAVARRAGRDGIMLPGAGWPVPVAPPSAEASVEPAVVLGLIRQESSFDVAALSPAGARGLMQLMPATAAAVARKLGAKPDLGALTTDPAYNMRLGTAYLRDLLAQFNQALPLALAGYNAGPGRVQDWLTAQVDANGKPPDMVDWIELIPFTETRNYVQRVIENVVIYRARLGAPAAHPILARDAAKPPLPPATEGGG